MLELVPITVLRRGQIAEVDQLVGAPSKFAGWKNSACEPVLGWR